MKVNKTLLFFCEAHFLPFPPQSNSRVFLWTIINMKPKKLVCGVGINNAGYAVTKFEQNGYRDGKRKMKLVWICPYYLAWKNMLMRCYSAKIQKSNAAYAGCTVSEEWLTFSNFKAWMKMQDFEGKHLDKDLLFEGNKVYGPETCVFISPMVNTFANDQGLKRGEWLIGVCWHKPSKKFLANCSNPYTNKREHLGYFTCEEEAHQVWLNRKLELAHLLASIQTDPRVAKALILKYTNYKASMEI